jgi:RecA/RadA recombinase
MAIDLLSKYQEKVAKIKDAGINRTAEFDIGYSTGFHEIDFLNGTVVHVDGNDRNFTYNCVGIIDGSANSIIGRSGSGKSTLCIQMAGNIIRPFVKKGLPTGLYIEDIEGSLPLARKEFLLGLNREELNKYVHIRNSGITTENVFESIRTIHDIKVENRKEFEYDTGYYDTDGNRIFKLVPTVFIIDSLPMLLPEDVANADEIEGQMVASNIAKTNAQLVKKMTQLQKDANIIILTVNHINPDIQMGFIPKPAQISGLKQGERLPGGNAAIYLANNMFRVDDSITLKKDKDYRIDGSIVNVTLMKSRTNATKRSVPLIFNKTEGKFDDILSMFHLLKTEGRFKGAGVGLYLDSCPTVKFSVSTFMQVYAESNELKRAFAQEVYNLLVTFLSETKSVKSTDNSLESEFDDIFNSFNTIPDDV